MGIFGILIGGIGWFVGTILIAIKDSAANTKGFYVAVAFTLFGILLVLAQIADSLMRLVEVSK